ncbi:MAG: hypothetical protein RL477_1843 [Pseudomonadota bacterium]|jgi:phospholipid transport system substrate-binding protein
MTAVTLTGSPSLLRRACCAGAVVFGLLLAAPAEAIGSGALAFVQKVGDTAITELTAAGISDSTRVKRMRKLLSETFDVDEVSNSVLGVYAPTSHNPNKATAAEFAEFEKLYQVYVAHNYAGLFKRYSGEKIEMQREIAKSDGHINVVGVIHQPSGEPIGIEIEVRPVNGAYKAVDLKVAGVSMPLTHRKQFVSIISQRGNKVAGLLDALRGAVTRFEQETPSQ